MPTLDGLRKQLSRIFQIRPATEFPAFGLFHYLRETPAGKARFHLRVEDTGQGLLLVNANRAYQLNPTAARMAYLHLEGQREEDAVKILAGWFNASARLLRDDYREIARQIDLLTDPNEHCALCELDLETSIPFSSRPSAPYRMDVALTYRCSNDCSHCYNARPRHYPELSTVEWKEALDRMWSAGIPHIVFTGGEPTLRADLPELIAHAESNGQITGLNTNGRKLSNPAFIQSLVTCGLDHVQITLESHDAQIHDGMVLAHGAHSETVAGIRAALQQNLYVMTNTTLLVHNAPYLRETLEYLADLGVPTVGLNALIYSGRGIAAGSGLPETALPPLLDIAREVTTRNGQRLIWYTPTRYCEFDPLALDLGVKGCTAALYAMCTEPDGAVIPCQSYYHSLGNLLKDSWESIWNNDLAISLRERRNIAEACHQCDLLDVCGGGCPLSRLADPSINAQPVHFNPLLREVP
jgi:radical SAM protein with 4Fe4S-binding SPASM domain